MSALPWVYDDGGRALAGYKGRAGDCVTRAISIACALPYAEVYAELNELGDAEPTRRDGKRKSSARRGVWRRTYDAYLKARGFEWVATMGIGTGCRVHLAEGELPGGVLVARLSKHVCAVIGGVIHDTYDPSREGTRCVYGYFVK